MNILKHQHWHFAILIILVFLLYSYAKTDLTFMSGSFWGLSTLSWLIFAILIPIIHQVYVLICWRSELYYNSISRLFGTHGFRIYKIGFTILILLRPITIILLAISNAQTVNMNVYMTYILSGLVIIPAIYLFYSVKKYFGMDRAFGIDHFQPEKYKHVPIVKQGIYKYNSNGMYKFGFLILWLPGILLHSKAALIVALFSHIYIWVHYYFTELPDINVIYKEDNKKLFNKT